MFVTGKRAQIIHTGEGGNMGCSRISVVLTIALSAAALTAGLFGGPVGAQPQSVLVSR
jgi:hypothetical protein